MPLILKKERKKEKETVFVSCNKRYIIKQGMIVMKHDGLMEHFANEITNGMKLGKKMSLLSSFVMTENGRRKKHFRKGKRHTKSQVKGNSMFILSGL